MKDQIIKAIDSPRDLERLYRSDKTAFSKALPEALADVPHSIALQVWNERLNFAARSGEGEGPAAIRWHGRDILLVIVLSLLAGTLVKLPVFVAWLDMEEFINRNVPAIVIGSLVAYFLIQRRCSLRVTAVITFLLAGSTEYLNLLPDSHASDTAILGFMHMPFFHLSLLGIAFVGGAWRDLKARMVFVRYLGELLIYTTIILIGGAILTGLTLALFDLIDLSIESWYLQNVAVYGAVASPLVATLLVDRIVGTRFRVAPLLATVFTPLFLATVAVYLVAMAVNQKSPFTDRDFLIAFNGLLLVVLALSVFSISERGAADAPGIRDYMSFGLVGITLAIDLVALSAILFRLNAFGVSPNRIAVLGANLLVFCHLAGILFHYARFLMRRGSIGGLERWMVGYVPAYTTWTVFVAFCLPAIFGFA